MIRVASIAASLLLVLAPTLITAPAAGGDLQAENGGAIIAIADAFDRAQLTQDTAALNRMVADDLVFIDGAGARRGKTAFIAAWTGKGDRYEPIILVDRTFTRLSADAWIVGAEVTLKGVSGGQAFSSRFRFADTFRRIDGQWRVVHIQVTRVAA